VSEATVAAPAIERPILDRLERNWETPPGLLGSLSSVDHKTIGLRYLKTSVFFLLVGGVEALIMRTLESTPLQGAHWSTRTMAEVTRMSQLLHSM